jgi:nitrile hydratase accessory protein
MSPAEGAADAAGNAAVDQFISDPDVDGPEALPRSNGELVFDAPWETRAFGLAIGLGREGVYEWEDFRRRLIGEIGAWEAEHPTAAEDAEKEGWNYYDHWLTSLEGVLLEGDLMTAQEVEDRVQKIADEQAHEHDHQHGHGHDHAQ